MDKRLHMGDSLLLKLMQSYCSPKINPTFTSHGADNIQLLFRQVVFFKLLEAAVHDAVELYSEEFLIFLPPLV